MSVLVVGPVLKSRVTPRWWTALVQYFTAHTEAAPAESDGLYMPKHIPVRNCTYLEDSAMRRAMARL